MANEKKTQKIPYNITFIYNNKIIIIEGDFVTQDIIPPSDKEVRREIYVNVIKHFNIENNVPCLLTFVSTAFTSSELKPGIYTYKVHTYIGAGGQFGGEDIGEFNKIA